MSKFALWRKIVWPLYSKTLLLQTGGINPIWDWRLYNQIWEVAKKKWQQWKAMIKMNKSKVSVPELTHAESHDFTRALFLNTHVHFALCVPWHNTNACCLKSLIWDSSVFCAGNYSVATVLTKRSPLTQTQWFSYGEKTFYYLLTIMPLNVQLICLWIRLG